MVPQTAVKQNPPAVALNPLESLSGLLRDDMKQVNALIMQNMQSSVPLIPQVASYLIASGGKRLRPLLTLASTKLFSGDMARAYRLAAAVEFIHTATLLHDDVVDESDERRGQDAANLIFGNQASVLVGDFLFSRSFQLMVKDGSLDILRILSDAAAVIAQGEVMQLSTARNLETTMDDYLEVIKAKTAALFAAACEVGPVIAALDKSAAQAMAEYGLNLGIAFQIIDDTLDYAGGQEKIGKTPGDDFREGKMTAPVLFAMKNASAKERDFWARTLRDKNQNDGDLIQAREIIEGHDAINLSMAMARSYAEKARLALAEAPDHNIRALLDDIVTFTIEREF